MGGRWVLAVDAMGVLYRDGEDVRDLLVPFIASRGGSLDVRLIEASYLSASLGRTSAADFWESVGLAADDEPEYLQQHTSMPGARAFLERAREKFAAVYCATNDVAEWSLVLRRLLGLESLIGRWIVSGEVGARKPEPAFFERLVAAAGVPAARIIFVDDRMQNVEAARAQGLVGILFGSADDRAAKDFDDLERLIAEHVVDAAVEENLSVTVHPFLAADAARLCEIFYRSVHELARTMYDAAQVRAWAPRIPDHERWLDRLLEFSTFVAEDDAGTVVAWIALTGEGYIDMFFCLPEVAGRGVGAKLYTAVEAAARSGGLTRLNCHASLLAQSFFAKHGWIVDAHGQIERDGVLIPRAAMSKRLVA